MIKGFRDIYGAPDDVIIGIGGWEQKKHKKIKEPIMDKDFRTLSRNYGFKVYLTNKFRIRCQCFYDQHEDNQCEPSRMRLDPNKKEPEDQRHLCKNTPFMGLYKVLCTVGHRYQFRPEYCLIDSRVLEWSRSILNICVIRHKDIALNRSVTSTFHEVGNRF